MTNNKLSKYIWCLLVCSMSILFLLIFSYHTSPITKIQGGDDAFFRLVGQGMTQGLLPYRDFFDMKGPYMFLIEYIAQLLCYGRFGCFVYQCVNLILILIIADKINRVLVKELCLWKRLLLCLVYLWILATTFDGGHSTEEFCLPFVLICVYFCLLYFTKTKAEPHPVLWAMIYGACFGLITFIRITNAVTICSIVLCITIYLLINKFYKNLFLNAVMFVLGFSLSILPAISYCYFNGILYEMFDAVFRFGFLYANEGGLINPFFMHRKILCLIFPMLLGLVISLLTSYKNKKVKFVLYVDFIALCIVLSIGNCYHHYFTLIIPNLAFAMPMLAFDISKNKKMIKKYVAVCLLLLIPLVRTNAAHFKKFLISSITDNYIDYDAISISKEIPNTDKSSVYTYGIGSPWYTTTDLFPCIKYCDWQEHYIELNPNIKTELIETINVDPPKYLVTKVDNPPETLIEIIENKYKLCESNNSYALWKNCD